VGTSANAVRIQIWTALITSCWSNTCSSNPPHVGSLASDRAAALELFIPDLWACWSDRFKLHRSLRPKRSSPCVLDSIPYHRSHTQPISTDFSLQSEPQPKSANFGLSWTAVLGEVQGSCLTFRETCPLVNFLRAFSSDRVSSRCEESVECREPIFAGMPWTRNRIA